MTDQESFLAKETEQFRSLYRWLKASFSEEFFKQATEDELLLIAHSLVGFKLQGSFSAMNFADASIVLSRDAIDSDYKIYEQYESRGITHMHTFVSHAALPDETHLVRVSFLTFGTTSVLPPEHAQGIIEQAKNSDHTQCQLMRLSTGGLHLALACSEVPRHGYVGQLFKTLIKREVSLGELFLTITQSDVLYLEAQIEGKNLDAQDLVQQLVSVRDFGCPDIFEDTFKGNFQQLEFLRSVSCFVQQLLVHLDPHMYSLSNVHEAFCYWPELASSLYELFCLKMDPYKKNIEKYLPLRDKLLERIEKQDTGKEMSDLRRKTALQYGVQFVESLKKTNFFVTKKGAISYRLDCEFLAELKEVFPEVPFGIFYIYARDFFGFHIRFQDLARGGMRSVVMKSREKCVEEAPLTFLECYQLARTQEKKNKDIPEGGAKAICFLFPHAHLYRTQRLFIESLLQTVMAQDRAIVDYYERPEYLYLGPDENMHDSMIEWIATYAKTIGYQPGSAFISSKPSVGINHKRYGVTSLGVNVCMKEVLQFVGINPDTDVFTVKMAGGPDGDVAGNQILNLEKYFPNTAMLITLIDVSGVIYDPSGLDLQSLKMLFQEAKPIRFYPIDKLSEGGFLLDTKSEKKEADHIVKILCTKKVNGRLIEEWLSASDAQEIVRTFVHKTSVDVFIPAGGRPGTLNQFNVADFLDSKLKPTSKAIIEGANLYLTPEAREFLEQKGTIIIKDSSANKGGVICSSFEVLSSLSLTDGEFLQHKEVIVQEILEKIIEYAADEIRLILQTHKATKEACSHISGKISERINLYSAEIRAYLEPIQLENNPFMSCFFEFCLPILRNQFSDRLIQAIPDVHKKAIIASWIASKVVYLRGLDWSPSIVDVLPFLIKDPQITQCIIKPLA
ncbi:MAG: NAD-glutamate dehydrogenase [Chlamydiales bacterium]|nr:NAD-glutamate dehydrogenase [Chlamydiales bacterium]